MSSESWNVTVMFQWRQTRAKKLLPSIGFLLNEEEGSLNAHDP